MDWKYNWKYNYNIPNPFNITAINLQWFAAEDEGRTEDPTEHKIRKAREEGKVAKSVEFTSSFVLLVCIITIGILSTYLLKNTVDMLKYFFLNSSKIDITTDFKLIKIFYAFLLRLILPIVLIAFIAALMGNLFQVGFLFSVKPITPDFNKIIPRFGKFFKKAMFSSEAVFNLGKSIFKVIVICFLAYLNIAIELKRIYSLMTMPFMRGFELISSIAFRIIVEAAIAMLFLSIFDYLFQKKQHMESLKMSKQEIKEERKMLDGDPLLKSRLKERMREIMRRNMIKETAKADVVITNPTHYAVAMEWKRMVMPAPVVVAKGADNIALKIKEIALDNSIPVIENKPLARVLYSEVEIGDPIPEKFYEAMAIILAEVYSLNGKNAEAV